MLTYIFIALVCAALYITFVSPMLDTLRGVTRDPSLHTHMNTIGACARFDPRSHDRFVKHLKAFMTHYSDTFTPAARKIPKLKVSKYKTLRYLRRIPLRIHNDAELENDLVFAIDSINAILESYIHEACDRAGETYFPTTS